MSPLKPFSLSPTCQGGAEEPVSGPGQAAPCVLGCDRPGGYLPAGPAEKPRREKGLCQRLCIGEEESPVLPDQATGGEWLPCPHGVVAFTATYPSPPPSSACIISNLPREPRGAGITPHSTEEETEAQNSTETWPCWKVTGPSQRPKLWLLGIDLRGFRKFAGTTVVFVSKVTDVAARPGLPAFLTSQTPAFSPLDLLGGRQQAPALEVTMLPRHTHPITDEKLWSGIRMGPKGRRTWEGYVLKNAPSILY